MTMLDELLRRELNRSAEVQDLTSPQQLLIGAQSTAARRRRGARAAGALAVAAVTVAGLSAVNGLPTPDGGSPSVVTATHSSPATDGPAVIAQVEQRFYPAATVYGRLTLQGDCLQLRNQTGTSVPLWPSGSSWDAATQAVLLPDGITRWRVGDHGEQGGATLPIGAWISEPYGEDALTALEACAESVGTDQMALVAPPDSAD